MVRVSRLSVMALTLFLAADSWGASDDYAAVGAGGTQPFYLNSAALNGAYGNPALLGFGQRRGGYSFIPVSLGFRSSELAMSAVLSEYVFKLGDDWKTYADYVLWKSAGLTDVSDPEKVSGGLTDWAGDGIGVHVGFQTIPIVFSLNGFGGSVRTYADVDVKVPGGPFQLFFSSDNGLLSGNTVDLSDIDVEGAAATEFAFRMGRPLDALPSFFDYIGLYQGAWGVGAKYVMGHGYLSLQSENSGIKYDSTSNDYALDAKIDILSAGTGLKNMFAKKSPDDDKNTAMIFDTDMIPVVAGNGFGFDAGAVFHNGEHFVSVDVRDIGMIFWGGNSVRKIEVTIHRDSLITDYMNRADARKEAMITNPELEKLTFGEYFDSVMTEGVNGADVDSGVSHTTYLPMSLNLGYAYYHDLSEAGALGWWIKYFTANAGFRWQMLNSPADEAGAELALGGSGGFVNGILPLRYGIIVGGPEGYSSVAGVGVNTRHFSCDLYYRAVGHPFMMAGKGFELATAFTVNWGKNRQRIAENVFEDVVIYRPPVILPDERFDGLVDSSMSLYRRVKTRVDTVNADLDARDAAQKDAVDSDTLTPTDNEDSAPEGSMLIPEQPAPLPWSMPAAQPQPLIPAPAPAPAGRR